MVDKNNILNLLILRSSLSKISNVIIKELYLREMDDLKEFVEEMIKNPNIIVDFPTLKSFLKPGYLLGYKKDTITTFIFNFENIEVEEENLVEVKQGLEDNYKSFACKLADGSWKIYNPFTEENIL